MLINVLAHLNSSFNFLVLATQEKVRQILFCPHNQRSPIRLSDLSVPLVTVKGNRFVTVYLTRAEFSSSYPTFDDDLKLVAFICGSDYLSP